MVDRVILSGKNLFSCETSQVQKRNHRRLTTDKYAEEDFEWGQELPGKTLFRKFILIEMLSSCWCFIVESKKQC